MLYYFPAVPKETSSPIRPKTSEPAADSKSEPKAGQPKAVEGAAISDIPTSVDDGSNKEQTLSDEMSPNNKHPPVSVVKEAGDEQSNQSVTDNSTSSDQTTAGKEEAKLNKNADSDDDSEAARLVFVCAHITHTHTHLHACMHMLTY